MILIINSKKDDIGVDYDEIFKFDDLDGFTILGRKPGTSLLKVEVPAGAFRVLLLRKTKIKE